MNVVDNLVCLLEKYFDAGIAELAKQSIYSKDFLYGIWRELEAETVGPVDASYFVDVTLEGDW